MSGLSSVEAQSGTNPFKKLKPRKPILERLDVRPSDGKVTVYWRYPTPDPEKDKNYPPIEGIILYREKVSATGEKDLVRIATVKKISGRTDIDLPIDDGSVPDVMGELPSGNVEGVKGNSGPQTFAIASYTTATERTEVGGQVYQVGEKIPSNLTGRHTTMFLEREYDECLGKVRLKWNPYRGWPGNKVTYEVKLSRFGSSSTYGDPLIDETEAMVDVPVDQDLSIYIQATSSGFDENGRPEEKKVSHSSQTSVKGPKKPIARGLLYVEDVKSVGKVNKVNYRILPGAFANRYELVRTDDSSTFEGKLTRKVLTTINQGDLGSGEYEGSIEDSDDQENLQKKKRYYYLAAVNSCDEEFAVSNKANSIVLRLANQGDKNTLMWDTLSIRPPGRYVGLSGEQTFYSEYYVYRFVKLDGDTVARKKEILKIGRDDSHELKYVDDLADPVQGVEGFKKLHQGKRYVNEFCYQVEAYEYVSSTETRTRVSTSDMKCIKLNVLVKMPNAIAPLQKSSSLGLQRNLFEPKPELLTEYMMYIYDRAGKLIYTGKQWDGRLSNGDYAREGAYIYRVKIEVPGRTPEVQTGSFMVVYPTKREMVNGEKP
ncbi:MAG: hypothetical protein CSA07_03760 [Bacteroidia bacterium]|nr:MAG: hypothetical protein CSA07_03760 [Bacteroidia bacterium]